MQKKRINPAILSIIVIVLIGIGAGVVYAVGRDGGTESQTQSSDIPTTETPTISPSTESQSGSSSNVSYKNGTYEATGSYSTPGGLETITVSVVLNNDVVESVSANGSATSGNSRQYQSQFLSRYESQVKGKAIEDVSLSRVAGSSLTSTGFNRAIDIIKNDAQR